MLNTHTYTQRHKFKTLLRLNGNWDYWSNKGNWKTVYPGVPLSVRIINIQVNEKYNRHQDLLHLNQRAIKRTKPLKPLVRNVISEKRVLLKCLFLQIHSTC